jgi:peptide/nickel transport system permease protein
MSEKTTQSKAGGVLVEELRGYRSDPMWKIVLQRFVRHRLAAAGAIALIILVILALLAPLAPHDPSAINATERLEPPNSTYWLGTDLLGRDVFSRLLWGGRISLTVGLLATLVSLVVGTSVGAIAGYFGGWIDNLLMRIVDAFLSFPSLFVLIVIGSILRGSEYANLRGGLLPLAFIIGILSWMTVARVVRATFLSLREVEFVEAARAIGSGHTRIMLRHIMPGAVGPIIVQGTLQVAFSILTESGLSYLGFGIQPPTPSWGNMLNDAQRFMVRLPWLAIMPGMMIFLTVMAINYVGDGLRDALDPRSKISGRRG